MAETLVDFHNIVPWTRAKRNAVHLICDNLADLDRDEIFGLRPPGDDAEDLVRDIGAIIVGGEMLEGFVAYRDTGRLIEPVAVAFVWRSALPGVAEFAFFGRKGYPREMRKCWSEVARRVRGLGDRYGIRLGQVAIYSEHKAARRMARVAGGVEAFEYPNIGHNGQSYIHTIWRF